MHKNLKKYLFFFISSIFLIFVSYRYFLYSVSFAFVDEYDNVVAGYFMSKGYSLFSQIFHNRQFGMVFISYVLQVITKPESLYSLILVHRLSIIFFSFAFFLLLSVRFGIIGMVFSVLFEVLKFFLFGNLFLAESFIVYPVVYFFLLYFDDKKEISLLEQIFIVVSFIFVVFMREVYIPLALFLFIALLVRYKKFNKSFLFIGLVVAISFLFKFIDLKEYYYQLVKLNSLRLVPDSKHFEGVNIISSLFYFIILLFKGPWNDFRIISVAYSLLFILSLIFLLLKNKEKLALFMFIALSLAAIRTIEPGKPFYGTYRLIQFYALLISSILVSIIIFRRFKIKMGRPIEILLIAVFFFSVFNKSSFLFTKIDRNKEFNIAYNRYFVGGEVIKLLKKDNDKLFVDGYDSLLFYTSQAKPSFKYVFYYPVMINVKMYEKEKNEMFITNKPSFYFIDCISRSTAKIPKIVEREYVQFSYDRTKGDTCLYISKEKAYTIDPEQLNKIAKTYGYFLNLSPKNDLKYQ